MPLHFIENDKDIGQIPSWVNALLRLGYHWPKNEAGARRIALLSMPCDSAAAGIVTLGAMIRDMADPVANDMEHYLDLLLGHARQYLDACRDCELHTCDPELKGCGYAAKAGGRFRRLGERGKIYSISEDTNFDDRCLAFERLNNHGQMLKNYPSASRLGNWHIVDAPPVELREDAGSISPDIYRQLIDDGSIHDENLRRSYSGLALAGRITGEGKSREACSSIAFYHDERTWPLAELLTIHGWSDCPLSRVSFFNSRTEKFNYSALTPRLIIADGDGAFLRVAAERQFQHSDIFGVIDRCGDRDRLEAVGQRIAGFNQWYVPDEELAERLPQMPRGISIAIFKRK